MMNVGVIGVGAMGKNHARIYSELKSVDKLFIFDMNLQQATDIGSKLNAIVVSSLEELLQNVDAVSVCVPTRFHFEVAKEVVRHHIHMLLEKPICLTVDEAKELMHLVPKDLIAGIGHIERFNPIVGEIQRIIKKPLYIEAKRHNPASARTTGSSVVEDLMIHDIDVIFTLFPITNEITIHSFGNSEVCGALIRSGSPPIYLSASRKSSKKIRTIYIEEEEFTLEGDFMTQELFVYKKPGQYRIEDDRYVQENIIEKVLVNKVEPLKVELMTFIESVKNNKPFPISLEDGLRNLAICAKISNYLNQ